MTDKRESHPKKAPRAQCLDVAPWLMSLRALLCLMESVGVESNAEKGIG